MSLQNFINKCTNLFFLWIIHSVKCFATVKFDECVNHMTHVSNSYFTIYKAATTYILHSMNIHRNIIWFSEKYLPGKNLEIFRLIVIEEYKELWMALRFSFLLESHPEELLTSADHLKKYFLKIQAFICPISFYWVLKGESVLVEPAIHSFRRGTSF